mmetsp:Transcript_16952/g.50210  ORF Transcript_16952/g.50210 Transcript_16952/m.50210 type:complete len:315 (+) Transcript_16952:944-1888(+)
MAADVTLDRLVETAACRARDEIGGQAGGVLQPLLDGRNRARREVVCKVFRVGLGKDHLRRDQSQALWPAGVMVRADRRARVAKEAPKPVGSGVRVAVVDEHYVERLVGAVEGLVARQAVRNHCGDGHGEGGVVNVHAVDAAVGGAPGPLLRRRQRRRGLGPVERDVDGEVVEAERHALVHKFADVLLQKGIVALSRRPPPELLLSRRVRSPLVEHAKHLEHLPRAGDERVAAARRKHILEDRLEGGLDNRRRRRGTCRRRRHRRDLAHVRISGPRPTRPQRAVRRLLRVVLAAAAVGEARRAVVRSRLAKHSVH